MRRPRTTLEWEALERLFSDHDTVRERVEMLSIDERKVDYALPQDWVNQFRELGFDARGQFVWSYEGRGAFGSPEPLTREAFAQLKRYDQTYGTHYAEVFPQVLTK